MNGKGLEQGPGTSDMMHLGAIRQFTKVFAGLAEEQ